MYYTVIYDDELYHFGVRGMKWGHRKISTEGAMKGVHKLNKIDAKIHKQNLKAKKFEYKSSKFEKKDTRRSRKKSVRFKVKANKAAARAQKAKEKGIKLYQKLEARMANTPVNELRDRDVEDAKKFAALYLGEFNYGKR